MSAKRKNRKHSLSEKLKAIELYKSGYGNTIIGRRLNIEASSVKYWIRVYKNKGCLGLEKQSYNQIKRETKRTTYSGAYPPINSGRIKSARAAIKSVIPADMHPF